MKPVNLNEKSVDILYAIHLGGGKKVRISANQINQNKNFYFRVNNLKHKGYIAVEKVPGEKSYYTLTDKGYNTLIAHKTEDMNYCLEKIGLPRI